MRSPFHMIISHEFSHLCEIVCGKICENHVKSLWKLCEFFTSFSHAFHTHFTGLLPVVNVYYFNIFTVFLAGESQSEVDNHVFLASDWIGHVRYINIQAWLRGFRVKIANFSSFFCPSIPKRDLGTKKTTPNIEVRPESLRAMLEYWYLGCGLLYFCTKESMWLNNNLGLLTKICAHLQTHQ